MTGWKLNWRIISGLIGLVGVILSLLLAQHQAAIATGGTSPIGADAAFWLQWVVAACTIAATALPSVFGQSGVAPPGTSETRVVREATREAVVDVLSDPGHPIRRELERQTTP